MNSPPADPQPRRKRRVRDPFPAGSRAAYEQATPELSETAARVFAILNDCGAMTHEEAHARYMADGNPPRSLQRVATIISGLRDAGLVVQSPIWGTSALGNRSARWEPRQ